MLPALRRPPQQSTARQIEREITLWTTKDGREIPLDEMSDDHISNAVRVLSLWRSRVRKKDSGDPVIKDLANAIDRFKRIMRQRKKAAEKKDIPTGHGLKQIGFRRS